jgi:diaminopimelate epimerase
MARASYFSGCGNDFLLFSCSGKPCFSKELIIRLCHSPRPVDGVIFIGPSLKAAGRVYFFNPDGSEAKMCGNGIRCAFQFLRQKCHVNEEKITLETKERLISLEKKGENISSAIGRVEKIEGPIELFFDGRKWTLHLFNSGVPHLVTFVEDIEDIDVNKIGAHFRFHPHFLPEGANVNFLDPKTLKIRTYERGVEKETLACGTGCAAAAFALSTLHNIPSPISLKVRSGKILEVEIKDQQATLLGPAVWLEDKEISDDLLSPLGINESH